MITQRAFEALSHEQQLFNIAAALDSAFVMTQSQFESMLLGQQLYQLYKNAGAGVNLAAPGPIGTGTPSTGAFTAITTNSINQTTFGDLMITNNSGGGANRDVILGGRSVILGARVAVVPGAGGAVATGGTISSGASNIRVSPAAAVTGVIVQAGIQDGQFLTITNEAVAANTVTMAAAATSNVADGVATIIAGLTAQRFVWIANSNRWFHCK